MTEWFPKNPVYSVIRGVFVFIDMVVYTLMGWLYELFFAVAGVDFLSGDVVSSIYYRIQLILGVFMIFKLAVSILQGIVNPDSVYDKKAGMGKIITRIITSLIMLSLMAPLSISSPSNEWERQVNNNGLLFGTLFSLQNRVLSNNTIGRIILGTSDDDITSSKSLSETGNMFASTVLKTFFRINTIPNPKNPGNGKDPATIASNRVCPDIDEDILKIYTNQKSPPGKILALVNTGCSQSNGGIGSLFAAPVQQLIGTEHYMFSYIALFSTVAGVIIDIVLIGYCVDVAVRVFKLAILRLIAPIPIISHMNISAKESKGTDSFSLWTKSLISTYLELFISLAIIYFVLFILNSVIVHGFNFSNYHTSSFIINVFAGLFIIIGLMIFARQAPKFIKDILGIQGGPGGSFGLSAILAGAGALRAGGTMHDVYNAARNTTDATINAYNQGKAGPGVGMAYNSGKDLAAQMITGNDKMTYTNMKRGRSMLAREGITTDIVQGYKDDSKAQAAYLNRMEDALKLGPDSSGNFTVVDTTGASVTFTQANIVDEISKQRGIAGKAEGKYKDAAAEQKKYGQETGYRTSRIDNKYTARGSRAGSREANTPYGYNPYTRRRAENKADKFNRKNP